ncbi:MAG: response regulator [Desulfobacterales bacterium]|nr:response regulator [Desulfobacterales bacterium]
MEAKPTYAELKRKVQELEQDFHRRESLEEELLAAHQQFEDIIQSLPDPTFVIDRNRKIVAWNRAIEEMTGLPREEMVGRGDRAYSVPFWGSPRKALIDAIMDPDEGGDDDLAHDSIEKHGDSLISETFLPDFGDGKGIHVWLKASPLYDRQGHLVGAIEAIRDITERKQAEQERHSFEVQFQQAQKMEAIGTLAGGIAHDFNNLLMGIQGRISLMNNIPADSENSEHLKSIETYVNSATELTRQLLGIARGGKYEVKPTSLNALVKKQNAMFGRMRKEITVRGKYAKDLWPTEVDRGQIEQVLLNLYVNASQAMPEGGDINTQTENVTIDESYVKPFEIKTGRYVKISVTDNGSGMDPETQDRIFDPFFTTKEMGRGTGLGLASAYGIIKNHGGFINVYSEKGVGTTFNFYIPATGKDFVREAKPSADVIRGDATILLVDDEAMIVDVGRQLLDRLGYTVLTAASGQEALSIYSREKNKIDLVILDMIMPGLGGGETFNRLYRINPGVRVILSSGYSVNGQATEILRRGCSGFIQKPFNLESLSQKVSAVLKKR